MSNNALKAEQAAIAAIESIFAEAGWSDGNGAEIDTVLNPPSPLFFHGATPAEASSSRVVEDGIGRNIYAVYNAFTVPTPYARNRIHHAEPTVSITIYYNDSTVFDDGSPFAKYLDGLLSGLSNDEWGVSFEQSDDRIAASDRESYIYRKVILATNIF